MKVSNHTLPALSFCYLLPVLVFSVKWFSLQGNALGYETDRLALLKFKEGITEDPYGLFSSWNDSVHFCNWSGIECATSHQRVVSLILAGQNLLGKTSPYIGNLSFLRILDLENNSFHGQIPPQLGKLSRLHQLHLNNNSLTGEIPGSLRNCSQLRILHLTWNNFTGRIPEELGSFMMLEKLQLGANSLTGKIPSSLFNLSSLLRFSLPYNFLTGYVPNYIGRLTSLMFFNVGANDLSGTIPPSLYNISSITGIYLTQNRFVGTLPDDLGITLPNLVEFAVSKNRFLGPVPISILNASLLEIFDIRTNNFLGQVPRALGKLKRLVSFDLGRNDLGSNSVNDLSFLDSLSNCSNLEYLAFDSNHFGDVLHDTVANLSSKLNTLLLGENRITGMIPESLEKLVNLFKLDMNTNLFVGVIPSYFGKLQMMQGLYLSGNMLSGEIPSSIGNLTRLVELDLSRNKLEGSIPSTIGQCKNLYSLDISENKLIGTIPPEILVMTSLSKVFDISRNLLTGNLPVQVGKMKNINRLDVSENSLLGEIPNTIGDCQSLENLYLQGNSFQGNIPASFASLKTLQHLDLSRNNLTGNVPRYLQNFQFLQYLNLSFNDFEGEVPMVGVFRHANAVSVIGNSKLCGGVAELHLPKCLKQSIKSHSLVRKLTIILVALLWGLVLLAFLLLSWLKKSKKESSSEPRLPRRIINVSYQDLHKATAGFSPGNLVGNGSSGSVYKGFLQQVDKEVAIKVLDLQRNGASKSLTSELSTLRYTRHRNVVKIITFCSSLDYKGNEFKALVFEYLENGSLDGWLHNENRTRSLNLLERLNIAIDVASALHYLHNLCEKPIIHCDIKPRNVLLNNEMVGHLSDFGIAKLLSSFDDELQPQSSNTTIGLKGTIGYAAPEYGMGRGVSKEGDMYSFGILVLEMFTGRRPTDEMFREGLSLRGFVKGALMAERGLEIVDYKLNIVENRIGRNCAVSVVKIGLHCSAESAAERMNVEDVLTQLDLTKKEYQRRTY